MIALAQIHRQSVREDGSTRSTRKASQSVVFDLKSQAKEPSQSIRLKNGELKNGGIELQASDEPSAACQNRTAIKLTVDRRKLMAIKCAVHSVQSESMKPSHTEGPQFAGIRRTAR